MYENNKQLEIAPALGIVIILVLVALAGLFLYKSMISQELIATTETIIDVEAAKQDGTLDTSSSTERLADIEAELEALTVDISSDDLFGLDELDAELLDLTDLDQILDFEL